MGDIKSINHSDGATLIERESYSWKGWTFGSIITTGKGESFNTELVHHEMGHYMQSQIVGPSYLLSIAIPSGISYLVNDPETHNEHFYTEIWANCLSKNKYGRQPWKK